MDIGEKLIEELGVTTVFHIGPIAVTESILNQWILIGIILILCIVLTRNLRVENPGRRQLFVESFVSWMKKVTTGMLGEEAKSYWTFTFTVLVFLAGCDMAGLLETRIIHGFTFMKPPTKDLNVPLAMALTSIVVVEAAGIIRKGVGGWLKSFTKPIAVITPINILELFIKPLSLCMRLFGNIFGAFIIMELLKTIVAFVLPVPFSLYFDIFDGLIQAYVFVFLTSIYIGEAVEE
ncbi:MAG: F0F1 ATP synthase subunit A [Lachnospiraceae bacterium]|nr:F0F1 ATP synthase subunit A [Lachnospiraceae bacterium]